MVSKLWAAAVNGDYDDAMNSGIEHSPAPDLRLAEVLAELIDREPIFHRPELGTTRANFEAMMDPDFWEIGASGRRYERAYVLNELEERYRDSVREADVWEASGFECRRLGDEVYLLTYTLLQQKERKSRRTTIWQKTEDGWKILFHQGTLIQG